MAEPFERSSSGPGARLGRLFGAPRRTSAVRELEDLLARAPRLCDVAPDRVAELAHAHGVDLVARCRTARLSLYRRFLEHCLLDQTLTEKEREDLQHLKEILHLGDEDTAELHERVARDLYGRAIAEVLDDHRLDPDEESFLRSLRCELQLPVEVADEMLSEGSRRARQRFLDDKLAPQHVFVAPADRTLELHGRSELSFEAAVQQALEEARRAVPDLAWFRVTEVRGSFGDGGATVWEVAVKAGFPSAQT